ncbi:hypothetical protein BDA96_01G478900 [Sorghum bicolor]|uniref:Uncharacterized protein n=1 Tax=Sorghum bicolor TaxID=4558 RepID=A0A921S5J8_SORBI|nr:hypothetical protein BDA96_01G478900 [Sorghum bicolor]
MMGLPIASSSRSCGRATPTPNAYQTEFLARHHCSSAIAHMPVASDAAMMQRVESRPPALPSPVTH